MHVSAMYANLVALKSANARPEDDLARYLRLEYGEAGTSPLVVPTPRRPARRRLLRRRPGAGAQGFSRGSPSPVG